MARGVYVVDPLSLLIVEPTRHCRLALADAATTYAVVDSLEHFAAARRKLKDQHFDFVVANLRLDSYNGIHLAYLARAANRAVHVVVHAGPTDGWAAREIQRAGALYEETARLIFALPAYIAGELPARDRRDPHRPDRRHLACGGRRSWDRRPLDVDCDRLNRAMTPSQDAAENTAQ